ncbi:MAG: phytanoyl-CoA dioxygenase family protein [Chloroherpetonaceae bacterium]|nr:phytanoyl-CoA dioxygenase family protein [Chthonomonadaceae bacterium]MDW8207875.1 phytanoyl-CoA dioxygenase family protein [Chloroherpetonaceae bacterium]
MLTEQQVAQFHRDGFLKGSKVLDDATVATLQEEVLRVIAERDRGGRQPVLCHNFSRDEAHPVWQIVNIWQASEAFHRIIALPTVVEEVVQLTGATTLRLWHDQIQYKLAGGGGVNMWHQDSPYWPILTPKTAQVTAWIALDDVDEENGCMFMVPGSHHWGDQIAFLHTLTAFDAMPETFQGHRVEVRACPVRKGEVHYHHALTWHGSPENRSQRPRRAIALHYMTQETRYVASGEHVMKSFVTVADGAVLEGAAFPVVYCDERVITPTPEPDGASLSTQVGTA